MKFIIVFATVLACAVAIPQLGGILGGGSNGGGVLGGLGGILGGGSSDGGILGGAGGVNGLVNNRNYRPFLFIHSNVLPVHLIHTKFCSKLFSFGHCWKRHRS